MVRREIYACLVLAFCLAACGAPVPQPTETPTPVATLPAAVTPQVEVTATASAQPTGTASAPAPEQPPFVTIDHSTDDLHLQCDPLAIVFDVTVDDPNTQAVLFFFRMKDKTSGLASEWSNGEKMKAPGNGNYEFILQATAIPDEARYKNAWLQYQFVAVNKLQQNIGRSRIFEEEITFTPDCP